MLILVKLQVKLTILHGCFSCFLNCTNGTKSCKAPHMLLPCEAFLEEPEGFHLKKEKQKKLRKVLTSHKFSDASNTTQKAVRMIFKGRHPFKVEG